MGLKDDFKIFCSNINLSNRDDMKTHVNEIAKKLNKYYYNLQNDSYSHIYIVGSVGRNTAVESCSDLDLLFDLPEEVYEKYNSFKSNGQSALLQEVKGVLKDRYSRTNISGDGQVVVIAFSDYTVELVPAFKQSDNRFKYPDTHEGGSWIFTDPLSEQNECDNANELSYGVYYDFCHIIREWKNNIGFPFKGLLIDTLIYNHFKNNNWYSDKGYADYLEILTNLFEMLKNENRDQNYWYAVGSRQQITNDNNGRFVTKAKSAYEKLIGTTNSTEKIHDTLRDMLGPSFPEEEKSFNESARLEKNNQKAHFSFVRGATSEKFIQELFVVDIRYDLSIDCKVTANGFQPYSLRDFLNNKNGLLQHNKKLDFYIRYTNCPKPYEIYWKVRNVGDVARQKKQIRGGIYLGNEHKHEHTSFSGPHFVECYLIKNNICVAKDRIMVPIE